MVRGTSTRNSEYTTGRDHSASGAVDNWTGHEHIYIGHFEIIYPSLNVFFAIYVCVKVDNIDF